MSKLTRRNFIKVAGGAAAVAGTTGCSLFSGAAHASKKGRVVVIGGGYGGAVAAKYIRKADPGIEVTLIEKNTHYVSCPLSNWVVAGFRSIEEQTWSYDGLRKHGVNVVHDLAIEVDGAGKKVKTQSGKTFAYDRLVVSPGVGFKDGAIAGYDEAAMHQMPHAWKAGPQTVQLHKQLKAMKDGDPFIIVAPPNPFRCPPGPYERAGLVAWYLQRHKPKSKVIILDAKDKFSKFGLFTGGWKELYGYGTDNSMIEWVPGAQGGKVTEVDVGNMTAITDMDEFKGGVVNVIPAMTANKIAHTAGLTDESGWCPIDYHTFESTQVKGIHVIGDTSKATGMPKSGYAANSQAKVTAAAIVDILNGRTPGEPSLVNTCYSMISPDYGISVAVVWKVVDGKVKALSKGVSPTKASNSFRKHEGMYNEGWYQSIMSDSFG
ncbi:MAG: FAD-dependent oxidoreductase [Magnetococcales bacterium]|nr:FAD-dependent oxidoreductase [Magnetococcales bacterium]